MKRILIGLTLALGLAVSCAAQTPPKSDAKGGGSAAQKPTPQKPEDLLDINSATAQQLKALPGITDAYVAKIIHGRPYKAKNQLLQQGILPLYVYDRVKGMIAVRHPK